MMRFHSGNNMGHPVELSQRSKLTVTYNSATGTDIELTINWDQAFQNKPEQLPSDHNSLRPNLTVDTMHSVAGVLQADDSIRLYYSNARR